MAFGTPDPAICPLSEEEALWKSTVPHCSGRQTLKPYTQPGSCLQLTVDGPDAIFGVFNFWATVNRSIKIKVIRVGARPPCSPGQAAAPCKAHRLVTAALACLTAGPRLATQGTVCRCSMPAVHQCCSAQTILPQRPACMLTKRLLLHLGTVPCGSRIMVDAVQTWTPYLWPTFLLHPPVWYQHILIDTKDNPRGCAPAPALTGRANPSC